MPNKVLVVYKPVNHLLSTKHLKVSFGFGIKILIVIILTDASYIMLFMQTEHIKFFNILLLKDL